MKTERALVVQDMIAAWNKDCETSTSVEDHMSAALDVAQLATQKALEECRGAAVEEAKCDECNGTGTSADYVGLEMRCVEVECPSCKGTGKRRALAARQA